MIYGSKPELSQINRTLDSQELPFEECLNLLGVSDSYSLEELASKFSTLSKKFHPDVDINYRNKYFKILKSYDVLKARLNPELHSTESKVRKPKVSIPIEIEKSIKTPVLHYTISLNWLDIFTAWKHEGEYTKSIRYGYNKTCYCEELCNTCKGTGATNSNRCTCCSGKGWIHYCNECQGKGLYLKKETYNLRIPYGSYIPKEIGIDNKGDHISSTERGPLVLSITFSDNVKEIKPNLFLYTVYITPEDLKKPYLEFLLSKDQSIYINTKEIGQIPYKKTLNDIFNLEYNTKKINLLLQIRLKLES